VAQKGEEEMVFFFIEKEVVSRVGYNDFIAKTEGRNEFLLAARS